MLGAIFVGLIARRIRRASAGVRRTLWPLALAAGFGAASFIARSVSELFQFSSWQEPLVWVDRAAGVAVPVALAIGVLSTRRARGPVGRLVVELGSVGPGGVRAALAKAVGDPTLELALWLPDRRAWVDEEGRAVAVGGSPTRAVTLIGDDLAAIVHDPDLAISRRCSMPSDRRARFALENERLHAELRPSSSRAARLARADRPGRR